MFCQSCTVKWIVTLLAADFVVSLGLLLFGHAWHHIMRSVLPCHAVAAVDPSVKQKRWPRVKRPPRNTSLTATVSRQVSNMDSLMK
jgi:hypothetical protein